MRVQLGCMRRIWDVDAWGKAKAQPLEVKIMKAVPIQQSLTIDGLIEPQDEHRNRSLAQARRSNDSGGSPRGKRNDRNKRFKGQLAFYQGTRTLPKGEGNIRVTRSSGDRYHGAYQRF